MKKKTILFCLLGLWLGLATACNDSADEVNNGDPYLPIEPENLPMFQFDEQGIPYRWETPTLSPEMQQDVRKEAIGYGWKWMQTNEIQEDGYVMPIDFYKDLLGLSPTSYYLESEDKLVEYFYSDAIPANAYRINHYTSELTKGILYDSNNPSADDSIIFRIWSIYRWQNGRWYMTTVEPLGRRSDDKGGMKTVWGCSQYVRMTPAELKQMQETHTYNVSRTN